MKIWIANCTKQNHKIYYREPKKRALREVMCPIGAQVTLPDEFDAAGVDFVTNQFAIFCWLKSDEIKADHQYVGICYSVDRPVDMTRLNDALAHNEEVLMERGHELRRQAAIIVDKNIAEVNKNVGLPQPKSTELTIEQMAPEKQFGSGEAIHDSITVTNGRGGEKPPRKRRAA